jgi:hypothetical protein
MSDTPRTDYLEKQLSNAAHPSAMRFCRELERENAELKAEILRAELLVLQGSSGFERENAELRKDKQRLDWLLGDTGSRYVEKDMALGTWDASEVFEEREDIDRLMELESINDGDGVGPDAYYFH